MNRTLLARMPSPRFLALTATAFALLGAQGLPATAQNNSKVELLNILPAAKIKQGLGFNVTLGSDWEFQQAKAAGATEVRMQFDWNVVENMQGQLQLPPNMQKSLDLCNKYGLQPMIVAAYGPPRTQVATLTVNGNVPPGSTTIPVSGNLNAVNPPYCHVTKIDGTQIVGEGKWAYYGALIDSVNNGAINLASATKVALPAGTVLRVNRLLYPSVASADPNDPSMVAYGRYVSFLADQISRSGLTGKVELWNEPPWAHDRWDARGGFYDSPPQGLATQSPNWGMLQCMMSKTPPQGVQFDWGGANKSGSRSTLKLPRNLAQETPARSLIPDSFHPYGDLPETHAWDPDCLDKSKLSTGCALEGTSERSNMAVLRKSRLIAESKGQRVAGFNVSEVGLSNNDQAVKARYDLRAFLVYLSLGADRINFYRLADAPGSFAFMDLKAQAPLQAYSAISNFMAKISTMAFPASPRDNNMPTVESYQGYFPLTTIPIVGRTSPNESRNHILFVSYQRTYTTGREKWSKMASPPFVPVRVRMPSGYNAVKAWDIVSGANVPLSGNGGSITYNVTDNPVAVEMVPGGR